MGGVEIQFTRNQSRLYAAPSDVTQADASFASWIDTDMQAQCGDPIAAPVIGNICSAAHPPDECLELLALEDLPCRTAYLSHLSQQDFRAAPHTYPVNPPLLRELFRLARPYACTPSQTSV
jgi:hypothetical protein